MRLERDIDYITSTLSGIGEMGRANYSNPAFPTTYKPPVTQLQHTVRK
jgi:hypothetical protein